MEVKRTATEILRQEQKKSQSRERYLSILYGELNLHKMYGKCEKCKVNQRTTIIWKFLELFPTGQVETQGFHWGFPKEYSIQVCKNVF